MVEFKIAKSKEELEQAYQLRWEILRKPWNKPRGSETDDMEQEAVTSIATDNNQVIATGRAHFLKPGSIQVRYMAVAEAWQGKGIGKQLLHFIESEMQKRGAVEVLLHARENAVNFYEANAYTKEEETETLYGVIRHWKMKKKFTT